MAKNSTIYKANLSIADSERNHYSDYQLTLACHPSETTERMMMRILAFALNADKQLAPAAGMSDADEPDLWQKDLTGAISRWIEVGQPDERRILKACGRADEVIIYTYGTKPKLWLESVENKIAKAKNLKIYSINAESCKALAILAERSMDLQITIDHDEIWVRSENGEVSVEVKRLR
ncbi:MAG: hypothetical protein CVV49_20500 [Spirochaetae bacterium HGW-Spirochaetae-5]|nr:MAG: hypothetical protein CVV49_20500 [Spirochaetae bacterium HGW-Spirochaetae-5]